MRALALELRLSLEVLGNVRFAFSPLAEVGSSLRLLGQPNPAHVHRSWIQHARPRLRRINLSLLLAIAPPGRWTPSFLFPYAEGTSDTVESQLTRLAALEPSLLATEVAAVWDGRPIPREAADLVGAGPRGPMVLADAIWEYWDAAIAEYWPRMCAILKEDVAERAGSSLDGGLFHLLANLHDEVSVAGDILRFDKPRHTAATYQHPRLTLKPSIFVWPGLVIEHSGPETLEVTYAARGVGRVWEDLERVACSHDRLGALIGRTRAAVLTMVEFPMSTTQIARALGTSAGSISGHLSVMRDGGMVSSRRKGRSVLYRQTTLGRNLVAVTGGSRPSLAGRRQGSRDVDRQCDDR